VTIERDEPKTLLIAEPLNRSSRHGAIIGEGYRSLAEGTAMSSDTKRGPKRPKTVNVQRF